MRNYILHFSFKTNNTTNNNIFYLNTVGFKVDIAYGTV